MTTLSHFYFLPWFVRLCQPLSLSAPSSSPMDLHGIMNAPQSPLLYNSGGSLPSHGPLRDLPNTSNISHATGASIVHGNMSINSVSYGTGSVSDGPASDYGAPVWGSQPRNKRTRTTSDAYRSPSLSAEPISTPTIGAEVVAMLAQSCKLGQEQMKVLNSFHKV